MNLLNRLTEFIKRERMYAWMLVFIIFINMLMALPADVKKAAEKRQSSLNVVSIDEDKAKREDGDLFLKREKVEAVLIKNKYLALLFSLASMLILSVFFLGVMIDAVLLAFKIGKKTIQIYTHKLETIKWNISDIIRVMILFLFFIYVIIIIESFLAAISPLLKNENFLMVVNSTITDILTVIFILHFTIVKYRENLVSLGLSIKNFFKNVFYGIIGYIATVPILIGALILITIVINLTKYVPKEQPVVELFLKEKNATFLVYTSIFTSIIGPIIEELFFRGFMYRALKKSTGIFWACIFTSVIFAGLHTNVVGFLPIIILGIVLVYLYEKTGTLVTSMTVHVIHNLAMVFLVFLLKQVNV